MHYLDAAWRPSEYQQRERGRESYELTFRITVGHDIIHTEQAWSALAALREAA